MKCCEKCKSEFVKNPASESDETICLKATCQCHQKPQGQTHYENDGCGEPAHNKPQGWKEEFDLKFGDWLVSFLNGPHGTYEGDAKALIEDVKSFISQQIRKAVEAERERLFRSPELKQVIEEAKQEGAMEVIQELTSNPNPDGSISPNIQHWIEQKQIQLKTKFGRER